MGASSHSSSMVDTPPANRVRERVLDVRTEGFCCDCLCTHRWSSPVLMKLNVASDSHYMQMFHAPCPGWDMLNSVCTFHLLFRCASLYEILNLKPCCFAIVGVLQDLSMRGHCGVVGLHMK